MTKSARGCLLAAMAMVFVLVLISAVILLAGGVQRGSVLQVTLSGEIVEDADDSFMTRLLVGRPTLLREILFAIDTARTDKNVTGLMVTLRSNTMGLAKIQDVRDAVLAFRDSGKWTHLYMDGAGEFSGGNSMYYLATAFDDITLSPAGDLNLYGLFGSTTFMRGLFDKIGVYPDMDSIGKYKNAKDIYTEKKMTAAHREATTAYLQDWLDQITAGIAQSRRITPEQARAHIDAGPFTAEQALERGLVDHLAYEDEYEEAARQRNGGNLSQVKYREYLSRGQSHGRQRIAVITGMGVIINGRSVNDPWAGTIMGSRTVVEAFREAREDHGIKAIVFRVDSPGGSALASDLVWRETQLARRSKPVIISMSDVAASGGYYVAAGATKIVAQPGTVTGSIGVVSGKLVTEGLYDLLGLTRDTIQLGNHASFYYTGRRYSAEEKEIYWRIMNKIYGQFTTRVAEGRGMSAEDVDKIGQGRVWTGARAKDLGLVDELGGFIRAVEVAKKEAGIPETQRVRLVFLPEKPSMWDQFFGGGEEEETSARLELPADMVRALRQAGRMVALSRERAMLLEPDLVGAP